MLPQSGRPHWRQLEHQLRVSAGDEPVGQRSDENGLQDEKTKDEDAGVPGHPGQDDQHHRDQRRTGKRQGQDQAGDQTLLARVEHAGGEQRHGHAGESHDQGNDPFAVEPDSPHEPVQEHREAGQVAGFLEDSEEEVETEHHRHHDAEGEEQAGGEHAELRIDEGLAEERRRDRLGDSFEEGCEDAGEDPVVEQIHQVGGAEGADEEVHREEDYQREWNAGRELLGPQSQARHEEWGVLVQLLGLTHDLIGRGRVALRHHHVQWAAEIPL